MINKPLLVRLLVGSRSLGLERDQSDQDTVLIYDKWENIPENIRGSSTVLSVMEIPFRYMSAEIWKLWDLYCEYEVVEEAKELWESLVSMREDLVRSNPGLLYIDLCSKVEMYRSQWDARANPKDLMYVKFWSDFIRDVGELGFDACLHRANLEDYRSVREGVSEETASSIMEEAMAMIKSRPPYFSGPLNVEPWDRICSVVAQFVQSVEDATVEEANEDPMVKE